MLSVNQNNFKQEVLDYKGVVFVDFYAEWCGPCRITGPIIEEISQEKPEIKFIKINVDQNPDLTSQYSISSIPSVVIFKEGQPIHQFTGGMGKENLLEEIKKVTNP